MSFEEVSREYRITLDQVKASLACAAEAFSEEHPSNQAGAHRDRKHKEHSSNEQSYVFQRDLFQKS